MTLIVLVIFFPDYSGQVYLCIVVFYYYIFINPQHILYYMAPQGGVQQVLWHNQ